MGARRGEGVAEICGISEETTAGFIAYTGLASSKFLHLPLHSLAAYRCMSVTIQLNRVDGNYSQSPSIKPLCASLASHLVVLIIVKMVSYSSTCLATLSDGHSLKSHITFVTPIVITLPYSGNKESNADPHEWGPL